MPPGIEIGIALVYRSFRKEPTSYQSRVFSCKLMVSLRYLFYVYECLLLHW